jgi:hypothetical protein
VEESFEMSEFLSRGNLVLFLLIVIGMAPGYIGILEKPVPEEGCDI